MHRSILTRQRLVGVFFLGCLLFCSPVITLFDDAGKWAGMPVSVWYFFSMWLLLVILAAFAVERGNR